MPLVKCVASNQCTAIYHFIILSCLMCSTGLKRHLMPSRFMISVVTFCCLLFASLSLVIMVHGQIVISDLHALIDYPLCSAGGGRRGRQAEAWRSDHRREWTLSGGRDSRWSRGHPEEDQGNRRPHCALLRHSPARLRKAARRIMEPTASRQTRGGKRRCLFCLEE